MLGPVMADIAGVALTDDERRRLLRPQIGGVILFTRNFESVTQLRELVAEIHSLRQPALLVAVDHEGGPVQRFREGFTRLPAARRFGELYDDSPSDGLRLAEAGGWLLAAELRAIGIDFSFAPVLDVDHGVSAVIGERALHTTPTGVSKLAGAIMRGMRRAGMAAVGKHFPGHGGVAADSHECLPIDTRALDEIIACDVVSFERLIGAGLPAIMPAHVIYEHADHSAAGFSRYWLQTVLRDRLGFNGAILSDDLGMSAALVAGDASERARAALEAGCDMVLSCNCPQETDVMLDGLSARENDGSQVRLARLRGGVSPTHEALRSSEEWRRVSDEIAGMDGS